MTKDYSSNAGEFFRLAPVVMVKSTSIRGPDVGIMRIKAEANAVNLTKPIPPENSFVVCLQLQDVSKHELWFDGKPQTVRPYSKGEISVVDLAARPTAYLPTAFDTLHFHLPESSLHVLGESEGSQGIRELAIPHGTRDPIVEVIGQLLLPALTEEHPATRLFIDGLVISLHSHLAKKYAGIRLADVYRAGLLASWQERRVKEMLGADLQDIPSIFELAKACNLSPGYFRRAFLKTTGTTPYRWLMNLRMDRVRHMLIHTNISLADIAVASGFTDQSHLSRTFSVATGTPPGVWRKANGHIGTRNDAVRGSADATS